MPRGDVGHVGECEIAGQIVKIYATSSGTWSLKDEGGNFLGRGDTLDAAKRQARAKLAKPKVKVEVAFKGKDGRLLMATGIHAKTGNVLTRSPRGYTDQASARAAAFKPETPPEAFEKIEAARREIYKAEKKIRDVEATWRLGLLRSVVEAAMGEAADRIADEELSEEAGEALEAEDVAEGLDD